MLCLKIRLCHYQHILKRKAERSGKQNSFGIMELIFSLHFCVLQRYRHFPKCSDSFQKSNNKMVCSLNTCFTDLGWAFWKSPGLFTLDLFSTWYLECHVQAPGLMMFSPFLCQKWWEHFGASWILGFLTFWHFVHSSEKGFGSRST